MASPGRQTRTRRLLASATVAGVVASLAACGDDATGTRSSVATVVVTETAGAESTPPSSAADPHAADEKLTASFNAMSRTLSSPVGLALVPVGGGAVMTFGDQSPQVAWSTIKVPLAVAAERAQGPTTEETAAIVNSDNAAAETLWESLGSPTAAAAAVTDVLRDGGDERTTVPSEKLRPEFSVFGQTTWRLSDAATFSGNLPCMKGTAHVVSLMHDVAGNQQWGVESIEGRETAVKGGWGPSVSGGYLVRQIGILTLRDGRRVGVAMSTQTSAGSMEPGTAALNSVAQWMSRNLASLPGGRCR
ncbi:hypothetical protein [Gordonia neofelifaecis]|uniref:Uncharacterized protein n=1 Tax=Gordonia neofelifaecis NRRL B-59395 TaxID=644548 RepID=F1YF30_9ACTN|nr:hypothetical protein [Gordonia neofelifaecis]EGD56370.1 hypothetical protein SCNU_02417 [Gordonia neofelifaecis NRRL B-59395]